MAEKPLKSKARSTAVNFGKEDCDQQTSSSSNAAQIVCSWSFGKQQHRYSHHNKRAYILKRCITGIQPIKYKSFIFFKTSLFTSPYTQVQVDHEQSSLKLVFLNCNESLLRCGN